MSFVREPGTRNEEQRKAMAFLKKNKVIIVLDTNILIHHKDVVDLFLSKAEDLRLRKRINEETQMFVPHIARTELLRIGADRAAKIASTTNLMEKTIRFNRYKPSFDAMKLLSDELKDPKPYFFQQTKSDTASLVDYELTDKIKDHGDEHVLIACLSLSNLRPRCPDGQPIPKRRQYDDPPRAVQQVWCLTNDMNLRNRCRVNGLTAISPPNLATMLNHI